jgi:hypothetical protein
MSRWLFADRSLQSQRASAGQNACKTGVFFAK